MLHVYYNHIIIMSYHYVISQSLERSSSFPFIKFLIRVFLFVTGFFSLFNFSLYLDIFCKLYVYLFPSFFSRNTIICLKRSTILLLFCYFIIYFIVCPLMEPIYWNKRCSIDRKLVFTFGIIFCILDVFKVVFNYYYYFLPKTTFV